MNTIQHILKLSRELYPILFTIKKKDLDNTILKIFDTGYKCLYPQNQTLNDQIHNYQLTEKITSLESSLQTLIGVQKNSSRKGKIGENVVENIIKEKYGDITYVDMSEKNHSGDAWIKFDSFDNNVMLEIKNYTTRVNKDEINKMKDDMKTNNINWGIFISLNSGINNYREFDIDTFNHHGKVFTIILISNLSIDIDRIDMGIQIIRKLINNYSNLKSFPWITNKIKSDLDKLNEIILVNYQLRDCFDEMELSIKESLTKYYNKLRDYQYNIDNLVKNITDGINGTVETSIYKFNNDYNKLIDEYKDNKKIYPILAKLVDYFQKNNIYIDNHTLMQENINIGTIKIQQKKILITNPNVTLEFNQGNTDNSFKILNLIISST